MTSANAMTREELLEYAALDAFGLLDEYEAALYTRSFHNAPAAVQDQIIQLQAQLVSDETLLPSESPNPALRQRVLAAVNSAIEEETANLEPLATIGRPRPAIEPAEPMRLSAYGQFWRAAAFALCAALIVVLYFLAQMSRQHYEIAKIAIYNNTDAQLEAFLGPTFGDVIFANPTVVAFRSVAAQSDPQPHAVLLLVEGSDTGVLVIQNLAPTAQPYVLTLIDDQGRVTVESFDSTGNRGGIHIALDRVAGRLANATWEISGPSGVLLASL